MARVVAAVLVVGFGTMAFAGGLWSTPSAEPTVESFLLAWQQQDYPAAAALTTGKQAEVVAAMSGAYQQLDAASFSFQMGPITQHGATALAGFNASVDLGQNGEPWTYEGKFQLRLIGSQWRVVWGPNVINPSLKPGYRLAVRTLPQQRQSLLDSAGQQLELLTPVVQLGVRPDRLKHPLRTARALGRLTGLDPTQLLGIIKAAPPSKFQELVTYPMTWYLRHEAAVGRVPALMVKQTQMRLFTSAAPAVVGKVEAEASPRLRDEGIAYRPGATIGISGLQLWFQRQLAGTPTTQVVMEKADGRDVTTLQQWPGTRPEAIQTTIDSGWQQAANRAVGGPLPAAVVAVDASTGRILAVAAHKAQGLSIDPLGQGYPPGAAFTIVSTAALLDKPGGWAAGATVRCPSANPVGGTTFTNHPPVLGLGADPSFADDFAHACATAFAGLAEVPGMTSRQLNEAAAGFGLGARFCLPVPAFSGSVQTSGGLAGLASDMIGSSGVRVSPLAMALAAARVASGTWRPPLLTNHPTCAHPGPSARLPTLPGATLGALRGLMQKAARTSGIAKAGRPREPVFGQTGVAPLREGKRNLWASWLVGYRGGVAFAVLELSNSPGASAVPVAKSFLAAAPRG